ncbi:carbohydrate ABC transporter substrate-binding protein [Paenibacillus sp. FSL E2-8871]|uniref:carbohydrate ABC transporter substrate-binding protein n=1 Tax=unclassified Paenibacillus TaxID=185978 RepID=UPI0030FB7250
MKSMESIKNSLIFAGVILLLWASTGCTPSDSSLSKIQSSQVKHEFANKILNLAVFEGGQGKDYWLAVKQRFESDYPGVTVNLTASPKIMEILKPQIAVGNPPDIIYISQSETTGMIEEMLRDKLLLDLTDVFEGNALDNQEPLKNKMLDGILDYANPLGDGKIYAAPFYTSPMGLIYNKTLFEKKGWKLPETWDEFLKLGELAKKDGRSLFTYQGLFPGYLESIFWPSVASVGGMEDVWKAENYEKDAFRSDSVRQIAEVLSAIAQKGYVMPGTVKLSHTQAQAAFLQGKALFIPCGIWIENEMKGTPREEGFEFGFLAPPVFNKGDQRYVMSYLDSLFIPAKAKNIELAKEFLRYQYNDDIVQLNAEKSKGIVTVKNGLEIVKPYTSPIFYDSVQISQKDVAPIVFQWKQASQLVIKDVEAIWNPITGLMSNTLTVKQWQDEVEKITKSVRELSSSIE